MIYGYDKEDDAKVFKESLGDYTEYLVDFFAPWCGPCKAVARTLESINEETDLLIVKVDTSLYPNITTAYGVRAVPTILIYHDNELKHSFNGLVTESVLMNTIENL